MIGANGRCKDHGNQFVSEDSYLCFKHRVSEYGEYIEQKTPCRDCKSFERIQTGVIINSPLKRRCVFECENFAGFYNDHTQWIDCNVDGTSCRYFSDDPYSLKEIDPERKDEDWIGFCKDFKQKVHPPSPRFESIDMK